MSANNNLVLSILLYGGIVLPFVPAWLIFFRQAHQIKPFRLLLLICCFYVISSATAVFIPQNNPAFAQFSLITQLPEFGLLMLVVCNYIKNTQWRQLLGGLMIAYTSIAATWMGLRGFSPGFLTIHYLAGLLLPAIALVYFSRHLLSYHLYLTRSAAFWALSGCYFYLGLHALIGLAQLHLLPPSPQNNTELAIFRCLLQFLLLAFFCMAGLNYRSAAGQAPEKSSFPLPDPEPYPATHSKRGHFNRMYLITEKDSAF